MLQTGITVRDILMFGCVKILENPNIYTDSKDFKD